MAATEESQQIKLLTIGDTAVGKSWLLLRWVGETAKLIKGATPMTTIGIDFKLKTVMVDGKRWKIQVWDTAGQERYRTITTSYYRNTHGILLVYDITDRKTFANIRTWMDQIKSHADVHVCKILVGNKCDLIQQRAVTFEEGETLAREFQIPFIETSAFNDINVEEAFMKLSKEVIHKLESGVKMDSRAPKSPPLGPSGISSSSVNLNQQPPKKRGCC